MDYLFELLFLIGRTIIPPVAVFIIILIKRFKLKKEKALNKPNVTDYELNWAQNLPEIVDIDAKLNIYDLIFKIAAWVSGIINLLYLLCIILVVKGVLNSFVFKFISTGLLIVIFAFVFPLSKKYKEIINEKNKLIEELVAENESTQNGEMTYEQ